MDFANDDTKAAYSLLLDYAGAVSDSRREIDYLDIAPAPITVQVPLWEYFERVKRYKADRWQRHFCDHLQESAVNRHIARVWDIVHAEAQLGKTSILSQCYPAWLIGHDPLLRVVLAMYNVTRAQAHSAVVIAIMNGKVHKDIFPNKDGWLIADVTEKGDGIAKRIVSKAGWFTKARKELNDGQMSFNPVGLQSGITGSGFDQLIIDDPYKESKEARSEQIRDNMANFWEFTIDARAGLHSNVIGMFHRYAPEDFAGFLLDTGYFNYIRYCSEADGDYTHEKTGQVFPDPLGREKGELISPERRPAKYYEKRKLNTRVWLSMFQGRPSSEEGDFFNVGKINYITPEKAAERLNECLYVCRSWDNAASEEEHAAFSVGGKVGIRADGGITIFDVARERLDTAGRLQLQKKTAESDGADIPITLPIDPGAAGKDVIFFTQQHLEDFTVLPRATTGSKENKARNFSYAVNSGLVEFVTADWNIEAKRELREFPLSEYKDIVDALADGYNQCYEVFRKGKIVKTYKPQRNLITYSDFSRKFPFVRNGKPLLKVPAKWTIYVGIKLETLSSVPTAAVIVARAAANTYLEEHLFVLAEYKRLDSDFNGVFDWIDKALKSFCENPSSQDIAIWAHPNSEPFMPTIRAKLPYRVSLFEEDEFAGLTEANWYLREKEESHPFNPMEQAANMYLVVPGNQFAQAINPRGLYGLRQEIATCGYDEQGKPTKSMAVLDCLRMVTYLFRTSATPRTILEDFVAELPDSVIIKGKDQHITPDEQMAIQYAEELAAEKVAKERGLIEDEDGDFW